MLMKILNGYRVVCVPIFTPLSALLTRQGEVQISPGQKDETQLLLPQPHSFHQPQLDVESIIVVIFNLL